MVQDRATRLKQASFLRDEGIDRSERAALDSWKQAARRAVMQVATTHQTFTTDEVWEQVDKPREPRALAAIMRTAQADGIIEPTSHYIASAQVVNHRRPVRVWRSRVFGQQ